MKLSELREGLEILSRYYKNPDGYHTCAEHDVIYATATDKPVEEKDLARLIALGWHQDFTDDEDDEEASGDFEAKHYRQDESWQAYT